VKIVTSDTLMFCHTEAAEGETDSVWVAMAGREEVAALLLLLRWNRLSSICWIDVMRATAASIHKSAEEEVEEEGKEVEAELEVLVS
jgi:hypothetical protein